MICTKRNVSRFAESVHICSKCAYSEVQEDRLPCRTCEWDNGDVTPSNFVRVLRDDEGDKSSSRLEQIASDLGKLLVKKNEAYGSYFEKLGDILRILYPNGIEPHQYDDLLALARIGNKLFRIASRKDAFGESPWRDIAGYGILGAAKDENK